MTMLTVNLLKACREKLRRYRAEHSGEYIGGMEYTQLIGELDEAIKHLEFVQSDMNTQMTNATIEHLNAADSKALAAALIDPPAPSEELRAAAERYKK